MNLKGLIFDFDGLIIDTESPRYHAWQEIYNSHGFTFSLENYSRTIGSSNTAYDPVCELRKLIPDAGEVSRLVQLQQHREMELLQEQQILPGVKELLEKAKSRLLKLAIASSSDRAWVAGNLSRLSIIDFFDAVWTEDEVENVKPSPELYLKAAESIDLKTDEIIAFEDSPNGIRAAKSAGIFTICVPNPITKILDVSAADLILASMLDFKLNDLMDQLSKE